MTELYLTDEGTDRYGRPVYMDSEGNAYVDIDYQQNPRKHLCTKYPKKDIWFGEPDLPVPSETKIYFIEKPQMP